MSDQHHIEELVMRSARAHLFGHADAYGVPRGRVLVAARPNRPSVAPRGAVASFSGRFRLALRRPAVAADAGPCG